MEENQSENVASPVSTKSGNSPLVFGVVVVLVIVAFFVFKPKSQPASETVVTPTAVTEQQSPQTTTVMADETVKEFTLEAGSFYYKPNLITVKKGDKVKVTINSVDMMHDFVIDELKVKSEKAASGTSASVEFTADSVGKFEFYCSVGQHRKMGMVGTLVVTE
jgi:plastocyanin